MKKLRMFTNMIMMILLNACSLDNFGASPQLGVDIWVLTQLNGNAPLEGNPLTLEFESDQVSGNAGCNQYGGSYQVSGEKIQFIDLYSTEMACFEPEGILEQEQVFLASLRSANRYTLVDGLLTFFVDQQPVLVFETQQDRATTSALSSEELIPTPTNEIATSTLTPTFEPPEGFNRYQDPVTGILVYIPGEWIVTGIVEGEYAILQSYPEDKYIGGEMREPGDTKCDLSFRPLGESAEELIQQWRTEGMTTIISEDSFVFSSGVVGKRFEIDSLGRATVFITEIDQQLVLLTCFGDFTFVDEIAATINILE
jgi:heat shock protein HslJ